MIASAVPSITVLLENTTNHSALTPRHSLFLAINGRMINDDSSHDGALVIADEEGHYVFNSHSHNGLCNSIESVRQAPGTDAVANSRFSQS